MKMLVYVFIEKYVKIWSIFIFSFHFPKSMKKKSKMMVENRFWDTTYNNLVNLQARGQNYPTVDWTTAGQKKYSTKFLKLFLYEPNTILNYILTIPVAFYVSSLILGIIGHC